MIFARRQLVGLALLCTCGPALADGLLQTTSNGLFLRLSTTVVDVQVFEQIALTTVTHEFIKTEDTDSLEVVYLFPLPENAAVTGVAVWQDSVFVDFSLAAADSAGGNRDFPGGSSDPALMDYLLPNPFVLPMVIRQDTVRVRLSYAELLPFDFGAIQYRYPLASGRFTTGALDGFAILVTFSTGRTITAISTPGFAAGIDIDGPVSARVGYDAASFEAAADFVVDYQLAQEEVGLFTFAYNDPADTTEEAGFFVSLLEPGNVQPSEILTKTFTFVLDRSGSMQGNKIEQAKAAARYSVEHLNDNDLFNIIDFSSDVKQFSSEAVFATADNVASAVDYIDRIVATGGTNINLALVRALLQTVPDEVNQIIFLTDGRPTSGVTSAEAILTNIRAANTHGASIFVFGVGDNVGQDLLQALADQNHGVATFIAEGEPIDEVIVNFFARISNPVLVEVSLDFGSVDVFDVYPVELPDMFAGFQQVIAGRYAVSGATDIILNGSVANADTALIYPGVVFPDSATEFVFIPKVWAKKKIDYLYARWLTEGQPDALKEEIIAISLKYGVLSPFTEFDRPDEPVTSVETVLLISAQATLELRDDGVAILLSWSLQAEPGQIAAIEIYRFGDGSQFDKLATLEASAVSFRDPLADPGVAHRYRIDVVLLDGSRISEEIRFQPQIVRRFVLAQNYPNPFNPTTNITFFTGQAGWVRLKIFNVIGEEIARLVDAALPAGRHQLSWNARDGQGRPVASGVYFYTIEAGEVRLTRKMLLAR